MYVEDLSLISKVVISIFTIFNIVAIVYDGHLICFHIWLTLKRVTTFEYIMFRRERNEKELQLKVRVPSRNAQPPPFREEIFRSKNSTAGRRRHLLRRLTKSLKLSKEYKTSKVMVQQSKETKNNKVSASYIPCKTIPQTIKKVLISFSKIY